MKRIIVLILLISVTALFCGCNGVYKPPEDEATDPVSAGPNSTPNPLPPSDEDDEGGEDEDDGMLFKEYFDLTDDGGPELMLKVYPGEIRVYEEVTPDTPLQQILFYPENYTQDSKEYFLIIEDMNFDGFYDIRLFVSGAGTPNIFYDCFLWDLNSYSFMYNQNLSSLANLSFDKSKKLIKSFTHISATDSTTEEYRIVDFKLELVAKIEQALNIDTGLFDITTYTVDRTGALVVTEKISLTEEQLEKQNAN